MVNKVINFNDALLLEKLDFLGFSFFTGKDILGYFEISKSSSFLIIFQEGHSHSKSLNICPGPLL